MLLKVRRQEEKMGDVFISGAKNSAIAIICASILCDDDIILENVPDITDVNTLFSILKKIGFSVSFKNNIAKIKRKRKISHIIKDDHVKKMRGSYYFMGALLAKKNKVMIANSGGCDLGYRPINYHLDGFKKMGATVSEKNNLMVIKAKKLQPALIDLEFPSVGATINLMLASVKTEGVTLIHNCAKEPEIEDVANFLNCMGANITGAGTKTITIKGVKKLYSCAYKIMSDRIEAGTYLILGGLLNGARIHGINHQYLSTLINLLRNSGFTIITNRDLITIEKPIEPKPFNITVGPYPAFPTDLGQPLTVLGTQIDGTSVIRETIFKKRYSHVDELNKMGAKINVINDSIIIDGKNVLLNSNLMAHDLRGAASLVLAAALSPEFSVIENIDVFLRGYEDPIKKLASFGIESYLIKQEDGKEDIL